MYVNSARGYDSDKFAQLKRERKKETKCDLGHFVLWHVKCCFIALLLQLLGRKSPVGNDGGV